MLHLNFQDQAVSYLKSFEIRNSIGLLVHLTFRQSLDFRIEGLHLRPRLLEAS
jgi:hypothetical protein